MSVNTFVRYWTLLIGAILFASISVAQSGFAWEANPKADDLDRGYLRVITPVMWAQTADDAPIGGVIYVFCSDDEEKRLAKATITINRISDDALRASLEQEIGKNKSGVYPGAPLFMATIITNGAGEKFLTGGGTNSLWDGAEYDHYWQKGLPLEPTIARLTIFFSLDDKFFEFLRSSKRLKFELVPQLASLFPLETDFHYGELLWTDEITLEFETPEGETNFDRVSDICIRELR